MNTEPTPEQRERLSGSYLGKLRDFGLGNPEGIVSLIAEMGDTEFERIAQELAAKLVAVDDLTELSCIDGRHVNKNLDGTKPEARNRRVGGTACTLEVARNGGVPAIIGKQRSPIGEQVDIVDAMVAENAGFLRSAHEGGCGGANGSVEDNAAICEKDEIMAATESVMNHGNIAEHINCKFDTAVGTLVRAHAGETAADFESLGWNGQKYVDGVHRSNPHGDEDLAVGHDAFHGHHEKGIVVILSDEVTVAEDDWFVWNLSASKRIAEALSDGDEQIYQQVMTAEIAKHLAVCDRLASPTMPIFIMK